MGNLDLTLPFPFEDDIEGGKQVEERINLLGRIRADYEWITCCQEMTMPDLEKIIHAGPFQASEKEYAPLEKGHYLKRYVQACVVYEARVTRDEHADGYLEFLLNTETD